MLKQEYNNFKLTLNEILICIFFKDQDIFELNSKITNKDNKDDFSSKDLI